MNESEQNRMLPERESTGRIGSRMESLRGTLATLIAILVPLIIDPNVLESTRTSKYLLIQLGAFLLLFLEAFPRGRRLGRIRDLAYWPLFGFGFLYLLHILIDPYLPAAFGQVRVGQGVFEDVPGILEAENPYLIGPYVHHLYALRHALQYGAFLIWTWLVGRGALGVRFPKIFIAINAAVAFPIAGYAILQHQGMDPLEALLGWRWQGQDDSPKMRMFSTLGNPLFVADYLVVCMLPLTWCAFRAGTRLLGSIRNRAVSRNRGLLMGGGSLLTLGVAFVALILSSSRGAVGVLILGLALLPFPEILRGLRNQFMGLLRRSFLVFLVLIVPAIFAVRELPPVNYAYRSLVDRVRGGLSIDDFSALSRIVIWRVTLGMWERSPLVGVGLDQFRVRFVPELARYFERDPLAANIFSGSTAVSAVEAHNEFFQILAEYGIVGALLFTLLIVIGLYRLWILALSPRSPLDEEERGFIWVLLCMMIQILLIGLYNFPLHLPAHALIFFTILGSANLYWWKGMGDDHGEGVSIPSFRGRILRHFLVPAGLLGAIYTGVLYSGELWGLRGRELLLEGQARKSAEHVRKARTHLETALRICPGKGEFAYFYGLCLRIVDPDPEVVRTMFQRGMWTGNDTNVYVSYASFLIDARNYQPARVFMGEFRKRRLNIRGMRYLWGTLEYISRNFDGARADLKAELHENPHNHMAALLLGRVERERGDRVAARNAFNNALSLRPRLLDAHIQLGTLYAEDYRDYPKAEEHWRIALDIARDVGDTASRTEVEILLQRLESDRR